MTTYTIDRYTARWDDAMCQGDPTGGLEAGDEVRMPEDQDGHWATVDGREADAFRRRMCAAGLELDYVETSGGWDLYRLVPR